MKVLFFSYAYPNPLQPGLGTFNRSMIAGLVGDHEVRVVSPVPFAEVWRARLQGQLPRGLNDPQFVAVPGVQVDHPTFYYPPKLFRSQYGQCLWWSVQRRLDRAMREFRPDVVLSYWTHPDGEVAVRMARRHNVPAVAMVGGSDVLLLARTGSRRRAILNVLNRADAVVTVSDHIANTLVSDGIEHDKLRVVRRGVDRAVFSPGNRMISRRGLGLPENRTLLVAVGRLVPVKGFQHLIEACSVLKARGRSLSCCILGDGPLMGELQAQIDRLGLRGTVELKGPQSQPELAEWYRAANMTVLSSLSEGVPNVLLESLACGTPFVATSVGGVPEIADQRHDRLVPAENPVAMADAIDNQLHTRHEQLPVRNFEPLALRAAARRLG
ncbi:MAG: glycosyltransferase, partial [Candidatus Saccharimonas sp.]|nr:glycosyltransferase [Planctomycetaceae bacterium]